MIPIARLALGDDLAGSLDHRTDQLQSANADATAARKMWNSARTEKSGIREQLWLMAAGIQRCMYCGDNLGTDIDHFDPISHSPLRAFDWLNHLLACSFCNSNQKRDKYPCDAAGNCLLIDPSRDDPSQHLRLTLINGRFDGLSDKGRETIDVFGLNRPDLVLGRENAFHIRRAVLFHIQRLLTEGSEDEAMRNMKALIEEPHASVLYAMLWAINKPGAAEILGADIVAVLINDGMRRLLEHFWQIPHWPEGVTADAPEPA